MKEQVFSHFSFFPCRIFKTHLYFSMPNGKFNPDFLTLIIMFSFLVYYQKVKCLRLLKEDLHKLLSPASYMRLMKLEQIGMDFPPRPALHTLEQTLRSTEFRFEPSAPTQRPSCLPRRREGGSDNSVQKRLFVDGTLCCSWPCESRR